MTTKTNAVRDRIRRKVVKNGSRGTSLRTLTNTARELNHNYNRAHVRLMVERNLSAYEVRDDFYSLARR